MDAPVFLDTMELNEFIREESIITYFYSSTSQEISIKYTYAQTRPWDTP